MPGGLTEKLSKQAKNFVLLCLWARAAGFRQSQKLPRNRKFFGKGMIESVRLC